MKKKLKLVIKKTISIREKVYRKLRNSILDGDIQPCDRIIETRIAKEIKTSRTPIREALHMLEREGLLEAIPRVGYRVKKIEWDDIKEICEIRAVNEILAARWAIEKITNKEIDALERNLELVEDEVRSGNPKAFVEKDAEFHEILVYASRSERLFELCDQLRRHMLRYRIESLYLPDTALRAIVGHHKIVDCIKKKDKEGIEKAIRDHLEQSKKDIYRYAFQKKKSVKMKDD